MPAPDAKPPETVGGLIRALRPAQLWSVLGAIAALVASAFALGAWLADQHAGVASDRAAIETARLEAERDALAGALAVERDLVRRLQTKSVVTAQIALFLGWRERAERGDDPEARARLDDSAGHLFEIVMRLADQSLESDDPTRVRVRIAKGSLPSICFAFDDSCFPLPPELFATAD